MGYSGPERRIHKVFVTKNTEYHTIKNVCIGVKDRTSGQWVSKHKALTKRLCGAIRFTRGGMRPNTGAPRAGESLYFHGEDIDVVTSSLIMVERPAKEIVASYPSVTAPTA
jgi:hypothetical protein